ncbi:universal stress protein [Streptomyces sp. NBC_00448]|uniref:universal stress protein n=1 Tax=Streptomyces sp. NBC_00448 TaxID=2903652 RepID=UPI002E1A521F
MQEQPLIVVMVSDDPRCRPVLRMAAAMACRYEGMVLPVHIRREFVLVGTPGFIPYQEPGAHEAAHARVAAQVRELAGPLSELRLRQLHGDPAAGLARIAREVRADLIMVAHPPSWRGVLARRMVRRLLRKCRVPVVAVPVADREHTTLRRLRLAVGLEHQSTSADRELTRLLSAGGHGRSDGSRRRHGS